MASPKRCPAAISPRSHERRQQRAAAPWGKRSSIEHCARPRFRELRFRRSDPPASLTGRVMVNLTGLSCDESWTLPGVPNVTVNLLNANNQIVATTVTDANGNYAFNNLLPGAKYSVQEILPTGYYAEDATPGDAGGTATDAEDIVGLSLAHRAGIDVLRLLHRAAGQPDRPGDDQRLGPKLRRSLDITRRAECDRQFAQRQQSNCGHHGDGRQRRLRFQWFETRRFLQRSRNRPGALLCRGCRARRCRRHRDRCRGYCRPHAYAGSGVDVLRLLHHAAGQLDGAGDGQPDRAQLRRELDIARRPQRDGQSTQRKQSDCRHHCDRRRRRLRLQQLDARPIQHPGDPAGELFRRRRDARRCRWHEVRRARYHWADAHPGPGGHVLRLLRHAASVDLGHCVPGRPADSNRAGPNR